MMIERILIPYLQENKKKQGIDDLDKENCFKKEESKHDFKLALPGCEPNNQCSL